MIRGAEIARLCRPSASEEHHAALGRKVANARIDYLWAVGTYGEVVAGEARRLGMPADAVAWHGSVEEALAGPPPFVARGSG